MVAPADAFDAGSALPADAADVADEVSSEQSYVDALYGRLDALRARTARDLADIRRAGPSGTPQNRSERDAFAQLHEDRLAQLEAVEDRLVFGRLDLQTGARRYIGRLGLSDEEQTQLLVDWRAPAARTFYQATAAAPQDVVRRRHLSTRGRSVVGLEDEVLDLDAMDDGDRATLAGEGALRAAVGAHRTGRMGDIVATIQAEQDRVIRSELAGALVVQGGPGTGKTAVALHRAAYLLYTYRDRLARSGVLLVGPNPLFLRYIEQVLPSLGETGVVLSTAGELYPGVTGVDEADPEVARVKGDRRMARVLSRAVRDRQRLPDGPRKLVVDGTAVELRVDVVAAARARARRTRKPHNLARDGFLRDLMDQLARELATAHGTEVADHREDLLGDLRDSPDVRRELNLSWMPLSPTRLLADLYADPDRLAAAAPELSPSERRLLARDRGADWTVADVPLLDELAELLGDVASGDRAAEAAARAQRAEDLAAAEAVVRSMDTPIRPTAQQVVERFADTGPRLTVAERAESDRTWAYGHLVVDEAQELSPMMWRLLMRRCPSRSLTLVGDVAQVGSAAGTSSWAAVLDPYVAGRWRQEELTVNYRTPAQVMRAASALLAAAGISAPTPQSVREGDRTPSARRVPRGDLAAALQEAVRAELPGLGSGRLAVVTPTGADAPLRAALVAGLPPGTVGTGRTTLDSPVSVLPVAAVKGLEFDVVVVVDPAEILAASPRGANDLYVALTRPTQHLLVLHTGDLPAGLESLETLP